MEDTTILGSTLGQLGQTVKKAAKQVVKIPEEMARDVSEQVGAVKEPAENKAQENKPQQQWSSDDERIKYLRGLYGKSDMPQDKSPEEQKKLLELRQQLHKENYYDPTFNRPQNPPAGGEERAAEKVENEKKEEIQDLQQKKAEKPPPLAVVRERNKAEMFRGASG
ncbi:MAG: hypothetical protein HYW62_00580 [Candidatus Levybacteria bacterium]|nr:hypothetical protein [Candidatus Levybacteria bacterium]